MIEPSWIKLLVSIRTNKKMQLIRALPEGDALFVIWIDLLCMAANINDDGYVYITYGVPYNDEELGIALNRSAVLTRLALTTFEHYRMITVDDTGLILILNFAEVQSLEELNRTRQLAAIRQARFRTRQKQITDGSNVTVALRNGVDKIRLDKIRTDKNRDNKYNKTPRETLNERHAEGNKKYGKQKYGHIVKK